MSRPYYHRRSIRLKDYDYRNAGAYFITICAYRWECIFGKVVGREMRLNEYGEIVQDEWLKTALVRPNIELDEFMVMPNHMHGILVLDDNAGGTHEKPCATQRVTRAPRRVAPTKRPIGPEAGSVGAIVGQYKSIVTKRINRRRGTPGYAVWQRNYHEHIIRDEDELNRIRFYIANNPA